MSIPNELSAQFFTVAGRKKLIELYGSSDTMFTGNNDDGEMVQVSFDSVYGIVLKTYQNNGWVRVNYYDNQGYSTGEGFDGRWNK